MVDKIKSPEMKTINQELNDSQSITVRTLFNMEEKSNNFINLYYNNDSYKEVGFNIKNFLKNSRNEEVEDMKNQLVEKEKEIAYLKSLLNINKNNVDLQAKHGKEKDS